MKYRSRYHENTRVIRINLGDYALLKELALKKQSSMAELIHELLIGVPRQEPRQQLSMFIKNLRKEG
ncbi:hypothetical protein ACFLWZ_03285 [Chloroflexota bacterium]